ncbi:ATP-binding protein [Burkholderia multivorans]|uniref:sce7725 family protein n=3 Tax=Burkholderia multivorans TaxID=87883 RepID=UPI000CFFBF8C|nr:sce7725 family protein [Burkholderia multivorans]MCA7959286.1 sce7725 family protein [Burkholderia multivorans]MDN7596027.1 sce7725 family protein [Burkholderia multivorans]PRG13699.1 ATP-binding protein [Burkholderia multivorans]
MYHPYFRGKQFELITIREMAKVLAQNNFVPVIEPVRESLGGLKKTLSAVCDADGRAIVIVNPYHGDHQEDGASITGLLQEEFKAAKNISAGILLRSDMTVDEVMACYGQHVDHQPVLIHAGFTEPKALAAALEADMPRLTNVFIEEHAKLLYRKHFDQSTRILVRDGFKRQRNADYLPMEEFSDLHVTYGDLGMTGFGDFLIVGDVYSEGGGPAYAVAIHLTFIDPDKDNVMYIYHFVSDTKDTPTDPAGKFGQALAKLIAKLDSGTSHVLETEAIREFRDFHAKGHFPGLGYVKKLSMKHHIETLANYLD